MVYRLVCTQFVNGESSTLTFKSLSDNEFNQYRIHIRFTFAEKNPWSLLLLIFYQYFGHYYQ